jgi:N-acetylglucosaminyldiphosphoundecaprenol N-acetyl-beta-D-mannosaminyltransferase
LTSISTTSNVLPARQIPIREAGVAIHDVTFDQAVDVILSWARDGSGGYVCTPNVDHLVRAKRDIDFRNLLRGARLRLPDGMGLIYGARLAGTPFKGRVTGRLLPEALVKKGAPDAPPMALVGGRDDAPQRAAKRLEEMGGKVVAAVSPPMGFEIGGATDAAAVAQLVEARPRILIVGMGAPKQEQWMARHQVDLPETVMLGLGQTIDILGERVPAAPHWMTRVGLEWAFRMMRDPRRIGRRVFVDDPPFFGWMLRERLRRRKAGPQDEGASSQAD